MTTTIILITSLSFIISYFITPYVIKLAIKYKLVDNAQKRPHPAHTHKGILPRAGGLGIFLGIFLPILIFIPINKTLLFILLGASVLVMIGIWDDKKSRSPYVRFFACCIVAIIAILGGVGIPYITNPFNGIIHLDTLELSFDLLGKHSIFLFADLFALLWIVWTTNIIGWSGGVDGQLPGFVAISSLIIGLLSLRYSNDPNQLNTTYLAFATAGSFLGFLPWNFFPQKIMPGYGGKTLAGFMLAILSILSYSKLGTALLVLIVPMTDAIFMLIKRIISGHSPVWATSGHLHHHLLTLGWSKRRIAFFYWIISVVTGVVALALNSKQKVFAGIFILVLVFCFIFGINLLKRLPYSTEREEV